MPLQTPLKRGATGFETFASTDYQNLYMPVEPDTNQTAVGPFTNSLSSNGAISAFALVQLNASGQWALANASAEATSNGMIAMALEAVGSASAIKVALPGNMVRNDTWAWTTVGAKLYIDLTNGVITDDTSAFTTDNVVRIMGYVMTDDCIYFNPSPDYLTLA